MTNTEVRRFQQDDIFFLLHSFPLTDRHSFFSFFFFFSFNTLISYFGVSFEIHSLQIHEQNQRVNVTGNLACLQRVLGPEIADTLNKEVNKKILSNTWRVTTLRASFGLVLTNEQDREVRNSNPSFLIQQILCSLLVLNYFIQPAL